MTKGAPKTGDETKRMIDEQLTALGMSYFDFYAWHGINNREKFELALAKGGPVEVLKRYQEQGVIGNVGFSTPRALPDHLRSHRHRRVRLRKPALLLLSAAQLRRSTAGRRARHGRVHHLARTTRAGSCSIHRRCCRS